MVNNSRALRSFFNAETKFDFSTFPVRPGINFSIFNFLAALFPMESQELVYDLLIILKIYLSGCTFSILGFYFKQKPAPILIGSIAYAFCGFSLLFCFQQPSFYVTLIILPLFIIGTEEILKGKQSFLFIILVFISLASNVYLAYDYALLVIIYFLLRYFFSYNDRTAKSFFRCFGKLLISGITGILLSGLFLLPYAYGIMHMDAARIGRSVPNLLYYPVEYYRSFLTDYSLIISNNLNEGSLGFSVLAIPCLITLFAERKNKLFLKVLFILLSIMLLIPFFGYLFSGFNNLVNRWCYAYSLCVSVIIMFTIPAFMDMTLKKKSAVMTGTVALSAIALFLSEKNENFVVLILLITFTVSELIINLLLRSKPQLLKPFSLAILIVLACISPVAGRSFRQDELPAFLDKNQALNYITGGQYASLSKSNAVTASTEDYYRVNGSSIMWYTMSSAQGFGLNGTSFYSSFYYPEYMSFLRELEMTQRGAMNYNLGLDARAVPLTLAGVKFHAARVSDSPVYPYGFTETDRIANGENTDVILQNDHYLPIGFTYDKYISKSVFESLSPLDKQDVMTRSVYLETEPSHLAEDTDYLPTSKNLIYKIIESDGVEMNGNTFRVNREKGHITLEFDGIPGEETYVRFSNLKLTEECLNKDLYLYTKADGKINFTRFLKDDYVYYGGYDNQMICLGSNKEGIKTCTLYFIDKGVYSIDDIQILSQSMSDYPARMEQLKSESLKDVTITRSGFSGNITTSSERFLCFTLPYDAGWKCYVDGAEAQIIKANIGFFGVELPKGEHKIEMVYRIPLLNEGIVMSVAGIVLLIPITATEIRKHKKVHSDK